MVLDEEFQVVFERFGHGRAALLPSLKEAQRRFGCVPRVVIGYLAEKLGVAPLDVYGVISFHGMLTTSSQGKYTVSLCGSLPCHVNAAGEVEAAVREELGIGHGETTKDKLFTLERVACLGLCDRAPALMINEEIHGPLTAAEAVALLIDLRNREAVKWNGSLPEMLV